jgi:hypothetical protein
MGEFNVDKTTGGLNPTAGMPDTYPATQVMMSDGVTSVEDAVDDVTSGTFTGNLGFTFKWSKCGKIVSLYASNDTTTIPQGKTIIGDIPDNILHNTGVIVFDCNQAFGNKCSFTIGSSTKKISLYCGIPTGSSSPYYVQGTVTYICN